jgi:acyl-CoA dehydrogenase
MGPLHGYRVIELATWVAGPAAASMLADWGADVYNCYRTADGRWLWLVALEGDRHWPELAGALGRPGLAGDPRFERGSPGLSVGSKDRKMGQAGAVTADVSFDEVRVPADRLIGELPGTGYATAMRCLAHGRIHIAALCVGLMQRLVDESARWAVTRRQSGRPIGDFQLVQGMLADSQTDLMAGRGLVIEAARAYQAGEDRRTGPSCAKYFASEAVSRVADRAVQIHGGAGYMRGVPAERLYRDARLFRIYEGTSQIQQLIIAREVLRAAREEAAR